MATKEDDTSNKFLPTSVRPLHYDLLITPDLNAKKFYGEVSIKVEIKKPTNTIKLHQKNLDIALETVFKVGDKSWQASGTNEDNKEETVTFRFPEELPKCDEAVLSIKFSGDLSKEMCGLYRTTYLDPTGRRRSTITTHFEPTNARRAFPCFDEPKAKATFAIRVIAEARFHVLSNMPAESEEDNIMANVYPPMREWRFATTPAMSTYLVALTMGEWDRVERKTSNGALVRAWAPLGQAAHVEFACEWAVKCLDFYDVYFDCPYVLPKVDLVPVENFPGGAMENWGLVLFAKRLLLVTPDTTAHCLRDIKEVMAHELCHMWFGNLVTPRFWDALWLKEGFATYFAYFTCAQLEPDANWNTHFVDTEVLQGKALDSLQSTHALESNVSNSGEANEVFDDVSYSKGSSVIAFVESYIGADAVRNGLREFVAKFQYKNAASLDLWLALSKAATVKGPAIKDMMKDWVKQDGFPLVTVERVAADKVRLTQSRFLLLPGAQNAAPATWITPLHMRTSAGGAASQLVTLEGATLVVDVDPKTEWVLLNVGQRGFVRVNYQTGELRKALLAALPRLPEVDRLGVLDDHMALVKAGKMALADMFALLTALGETEQSPAVWQLICAFWRWGALLWGDEPQFQSAGRALFARVWRELGATETAGESSERSMLRPRVLSCLSLSGDAAVNALALQLCTGGDPLAVPANLRGAVWGAAVREGAQPVADALVALLQRGALDDVAAQQALMAIQQTRNVADAERHLGLVLPAADGKTASRIKSEFLRSLVSGAANSNSAVRAAAFAFVQAQWKTLVTAGGGAGACAEDLIAPFSALSDEASAKKIKEFVTRLDPETKSFVSKTAAQTAEEILSNSSIRAAGIVVLQSARKN